MGKSGQVTYSLPSGIDWKQLKQLIREKGDSVEGEPSKRMLRDGVRVAELSGPDAFTVGDLRAEPDLIQQFAATAKTYVTIVRGSEVCDDPSQLADIGLELQAMASIPSSIPGIVMRWRITTDTYLHLKERTEGGKSILEEVKTSESVDSNGKRSSETPPPRTIDMTSGTES